MKEKQLSKQILHRLTEKDLSLTELDFSGVSFPDDEFEKLTQAMTDNQSLTSLDFSDCGIPVYQGLRLALALSSIRGLMILKINGNQIEKPTIKIIINQLMMHSGHPKSLIICDPLLSSKSTTLWFYVAI